MSYYFGMKKDHLSYSSLKHFAKSPASFVEYKQTKFKPTAEMLFGSLADCLTLQPKQYSKRYVCEDGILSQIGGSKPRGTTRYADWFKALPESALIINKSDLDRAKGASHAVKNNKKTKEYFDCIKPDSKNVQIEFNIIHKTGLKLKGIIDAHAKVRDSVKFMIELKTAASANPKKFNKQAIDLGYHLQIGSYDYYYESIFERPELFFMVVESKPPFNVAKIRVTDEFRQYGRNELDRLMSEFKRCIKEKAFDQSYEFFGGGDFEIYLPNYLK